MDAETVVLPDGLADLPPGPALAAALSTVDRAGLTGPQLAIVVMARGRQVAHEQALLLADVHELGQIPWDCPGRITRQQADEFSADQVAMTLTAPRWWASNTLRLGHHLLTRLPIVYEALLAGRIDYLRAQAFADVLALVDDDVARAIAAKLMGKAEGWDASNLRLRLNYHVQKADPELAKRRYQNNVVNRDVFIAQDSEGTATLSGINLPIDRAAAAENRIDRLARAAKADGDSRTLAQLRADAMLDTLIGTAFRLRPSNDPYTTNADHTATQAQAQAQAQAKAEAEAKAGTKARTEAGTEAGGASAPANAEAGAAQAGVAQAEAGRAEAGAETSGPAPAGMAAEARMCACGGVQPAHRRGVVDVLVKMTTLMYLDDDPGFIPGWGPVIADIARQIAFDQKTNPAWKWSATDENGQLLHHGHTGRRPTAAETAFIQARDRTCRAPGCRRPAIRCDIDHRQEHSKHGPSHRGNACCECRHHHRLKHEKSFTVTPYGPAGFMWAAPDGRLYLNPGDGNIVAVADALDDDDGVWDLDNCPPPKEVRQIIPA